MPAEDRPWTVLLRPLAGLAPTRTKAQGKGLSAVFFGELWCVALRVTRYFMIMTLYSNSHSHSVIMGDCL